MKFRLENEASTPGVRKLSLKRDAENADLVYLMVDDVWVAYFSEVRSEMVIRNESTDPCSCSITLAAGLTLLFES